MQFNVAQLVKGEIGEIRQYTLHEDIGTLDPGVIPSSALDGKIQMLRTADGVLVTGNLHASVELVCSRCAELFSLPLRFTVEEEFRPTIDILTGASLPLPEDDEPATRIDERHLIDLTEVIRQNLLLAIPPNPICRSRCAGLCPVCGQNWNDGPCDCRQDDIDPRLEVLKQLLDD